MTEHDEMYGLTVDATRERMVEIRLGPERVLLSPDEARRFAHRLAGAYLIANGEIVGAAR